MTASVLFITLVFRAPGALGARVFGFEGTSLMTDAVAGAGQTGPEDRRPEVRRAAPDEFLSPLTREARALIARVAETLGEPSVRERREVAQPGERQRRLVTSEEGVHDALLLRTLLHDTVCALAHEHRQLGVPPERMLVLLKEMVSDVHSDVDPETRALINDIVSWSVEAYFAA